MEVVNEIGYSHISEVSTADAVVFPANIYTHSNAFAFIY